MRPQLEIRALHTARQVVMEHGTMTDLHTLFNLLLDCDVISEETFLTWRNLKDGPDLLSPEHHRKAVASAANFFDFLEKTRCERE